MISVEHLTKCYGDFKAVDDLNFEIEEGHVYGFLGPNGAGKSTTMNIMTGCLSPTEGSVKIGGFDIFDEPQKAKQLIGYLPEQPPLYVNESAVEYLKFVGEAKGLKGQELWKQIGKVIKQTKIEDVCEKQISKLSKGYKQRVGIAQALLGNPKVIILDEPTVGLDPIQITEIRELIKNLGKEHTVIFSSHILSEVQVMCDKIIIIAQGKLIAFDDTESIERSLTASNGIRLRTECGPEVTSEILTGCDIETDWEITRSTENITETGITLNDKESDDICRKIFYGFATKNIAILEMSVKKANLEEIFIELTTAKPEINDESMLEVEEDVPTNEEDVPVNEEDVPANEEDMSEIAENMPVNEENVPVNEENVPVNEEDIPENEEEVKADDSSL